MTSILIVEDDGDLLHTLEYTLRREGYRTHAFATGEEGLDWAMRHGPLALALLDVILPGASGIDVCARLRAHERTRSMPIMFLSGRNDAIDRAIGFELGADDYIIKPFNIRELLLRVRAVLHRSTGQKTAAAVTGQVLGTLRLDPERHQVWVEEREVSLTALEFKLLSLLMVRRGRVQSRETLLASVWGLGGLPRTRTVDVHIKHLRAKLGPAGEMLETVWGLGYCMRASCVHEDESRRSHRS